MPNPVPLGRPPPPPNEGMLGIAAGAGADEAGGGELSGGIPRSSSGKCVCIRFELGFRCRRLSLDGGVRRRRGRAARARAGRRHRGRLGMSCTATSTRPSAPSSTYRPGSRRQPRPGCRAACRSDSAESRALRPGCPDRIGLPRLVRCHVAGCSARPCRRRPSGARSGPRSLLADRPEPSSNSDAPERLPRCLMASAASPS